MTKETELILLKEIKKLNEKVAFLERKFLGNEEEKEKSITTYRFSSMTTHILENLVSIREIIPRNIFHDWFNLRYKIKKNTINFLKILIAKNKYFIKNYHEDDLKSNFIIPLLNKVEFRDIDREISAYYHRSLTYKTSKFILNGYCDFYVAKGLLRPEKPYFFIQEFKPDSHTSHPEPQLVSELISAIELNKTKTIRGAYIVANIWRFVILEKLEKHNYRYYVSHNFDCMKLKELKAIYRNLLFVKNEIIEMVVLENKSK